jgi:nitrogen fixation-related uncharacterized protein
VIIDAVQVSIFAVWLAIMTILWCVGADDEL